MKGRPGMGRSASSPPTGAASNRLVAFFLSIVVLTAALHAGAATGAPKFPELTGRVVDNASLLKPEDRAWIEAELKTLEEKSTDQVAVVTVSTLDGYTIEDYGYQLGRLWGLGEKGKDNGALLIVAPNERKVRIEVGRRLEPLLTDTMSSVIIQNAILPSFRKGDFSGAIRAGVRDIKDVLLGDAEAVKQRAKSTRKDEQFDTMALIFIAIWLAMFAFIIYAHMRHARQHPRTVGRRRARYGNSDGTIIVIPGGGSSDWGGGWSGGGGGGSGGGGDFGGGGATGSW
jgi:uncharacterized protein